MKKTHLYTLWGGLFIVCAGLGFIPSPSGSLQTILKILSLVFFVPPALLLYQAKKQGDAAGRKLIRNLSALSLLLTLLLLTANILSAGASEHWGSLLHSMLVIVSTPMICSGQWALSLFCWACVLMDSLKK